MFLKNIIIQKESKRGVQQWHFDQKKAIWSCFFIFFSLSILILFLSNLISSSLYEKRVNEFKLNYKHIANNLELINNRIKTLDKQIDDIEVKDSAIRTYAGMPKIDKDIRKLGIGGMKLQSNKFFDNVAPNINRELSILEMDIEKLSRQVNFEIKSYNSIYDEVQKNIKRISKIPSIRPVNGGYLNSTFGYRLDPIDNVKRFHHGQDITVKSGSPIFAPADGEIKRAYYVGGFGNHIKIDHGLGYTTLFAHLSKLKVKHGQKVKRGEMIGYSGNTGRSTAPHLHYEIHYYGEPQNPLDYFFSEN